MITPSKMHRELFVGVMFSLVVWIKLKSFNSFFFFAMYILFSGIYILYLCDYIFKIIESKVDENEEDLEVEKSWDI